MNIWFLLAAALALVTALLHSVNGEKEIVRPLRAGADPLRFAVVDAGWHVITWHLGVTAVALVVTAFRPIEGLADWLIVQWLGYAAAFLALTLKRFRRFFALPQWTLFLALSALTAVGAYPRPSAFGGPFAAALLSGVVLAAIAALHVYWALGGHWPGHDGASLAQTVLGGPSSARLPGVALTLLVALALLGSSGLALHAGGVVSIPLVPHAVATVGGWLVASVLLLRGLGGFFDGWLRPTIAGTPYAFWNRVLYSPLCVGLSALVTLALLG